MGYSVHDKVTMRNRPRVVKISASGSEDTAALQAAIDALNSTGGGYLVMLPGEYTSSQLNLKSHVRLKLKAGVTLTSVADLGASEPIIMIAAGVTDCAVVGQGTITMAGQYTSGEHRHGIHLQACSRVSIVGVKVTECGGDGIYLTDDAPTDITIDNVWCDKNRRQGISIVGANGVTIKNSRLTDTGRGVSGGTSPQAGMDIEPLAGRACKNIVLQNNTYTNNVSCGLTVNLSLLDADQEFSLDVTGDVFEHNYGDSLVLARAPNTNVDNGHVNITGVTINESGGSGIRISEWASDAPLITISDATIQDGNIINSTDFSYRSHIAIVRDAGSVLTHALGNVIVTGVSFIDTRTTTSTGFFAYTAGSGTQPVAGDTVVDGSANGTVASITVTGGTWAGGDAAGVIKLRSQTTTAFVAGHTATFAAGTATVGTVTVHRSVYFGVYGANNRAGATENINPVYVADCTFSWTVEAYKDPAYLIVNYALSQIICDISYAGDPTAKLRVSKNSRYYSTGTGLWYLKDSADDATGWGAPGASPPPPPAPPA